MIAEVTIHFGQEWRDLAYCLFGMSCGVFIGVILTIDHMQRKARKK
jgi:hypothetical protein